MKGCVLKKSVLVLMGVLCIHQVALADDPGVEQFSYTKLLAQYGLKPVGKLVDLVAPYLPTWEEATDVASSWTIDPAKNLAQKAFSPWTAQSVSGGGGGGDDPPVYLVTDPALVDKVNRNTTAIGDLQDQIHRNDKKAARGIAAMAALGNVATPSAPGKTVIGAGVGSYDGEQAIAFNISHRPKSFGNVTLQAGIGSSNGGKPVMRAGVSYEF